VRPVRQIGRKRPGNLFLRSTAIPLENIDSLQSTIAPIMTVSSSAANLQLKSRFGCSAHEATGSASARSPPGVKTCHSSAPSCFNRRPIRIRDMAVCNANEAKFGIAIIATGVPIFRSLSSGSLPPGAGLRPAMKGAGLGARHQAEIFRAVDRQMREGVVDYEMVDVVMRDAGLGGEARRFGGYAGLPHPWRNRRRYRGAEGALL
jgi:hypothetical protein